MAQLEDGEQEVVAERTALLDGQRDAVRARSVLRTCWSFRLTLAACACVCQLRCVETLASRRALAVRRARLLRTAFSALAKAVRGSRADCLLARSFALFRRQRLTRALRAWRARAAATALRRVRLRVLRVLPNEALR